MSKEALIELVKTLQSDLSSLKGRLESIEKRNHKIDLRKKFLK